MKIYHQNYHQNEAYGIFVEELSMKSTSYSKDKGKNKSPETTISRDLAAI